MSQLSPLDLYQQELSDESFCYDTAQERAIKSLQRVYEALISAAEIKSRINKLLSFGVNKKAPPQGLYLWGGVGRGKTHLMDIFYETLPFRQKLRVHFHRFMQQLHVELNQLKGQKDPLKIVAKRMAWRYRVICFDEFFVIDITDAMLLSTLFDALFEHGVVLVATSNIVPDDLYHNGLQRCRFLPAIKLINKHCEIVNIDGGIDYRLRTLEQAEIYHHPLDNQAEENLNYYFNQLVIESQVTTKPLDINERAIPIRKQSEGVLLIDFESLCNSPRSPQDYIKIAERYHTVLLSGVEQMGEQLTGDDVARRFVTMVDEFYERNVTLIISAAVALEDIYTQGKLCFEFERCGSRLLEMQSYDYLALMHLP